MNIATLGYEITDAGGTYNFPYNSPVEVFRIYTSTAVTLSADMSFDVTGSPIQGDFYTFMYEGDVTPNGFLLRFMGEGLVLEQGESRFIIEAFYTGTLWNVYFLPNAGPGSTSINGSSILQSSVTESSLAGNIGLSKLSNAAAEGYSIRAGTNGVPEYFDASTAGQILLGDGTDLISSPVTGDVTISGGGVTTIGANKVLTANISNSNVTLAKLETILKTEVITLDVSFVAGELGDFKIQMPYAGSLVDIYAYAYVVIAGADNGTIVPKNNAGTTMGTGTVTYTAADPRGTAYTSSPSSNNTFVIDDILTFTTAKVTAGGRVKLSLSIIRS